MWQELGTSRIPPRSFLVGAAVEMGPKIEKMAARAVMSVLRGGGLYSAEMRELIHLLREAGHQGPRLRSRPRRSLRREQGQGAADFVDRVTTSVNDLALFFANEPDDRVAAAFEQMRENLKAEYARLFPDIPETTSAMVDHIVECIRARRREIERGGHPSDAKL